MNPKALHLSQNPSWPSPRPSLIAEGKEEGQAMSSPAKPVVLLLQMPRALPDSVLSLPCSCYLHEMFTSLRHHSEISSDATSEKPSLISSSNPHPQSFNHQLLSVTVPLFCFLSSSLRTWHNFHYLCFQAHCLISLLANESPMISGSYYMTWKLCEV